jgi:6-phosphofructokinase 1
MEKPDFTIPVLGKPTVHVPTKFKKKDFWGTSYVGDDQYILYDIAITKDTSISNYNQHNLIEKAGPREKIYFDPAKVHAGIVTCGGLCPGLNDVIRAIVMTLWYFKI